jgi:hypothetical protein
MGTGFEQNSEEDIGIIPRAVDHLFKGITERQMQAKENNEPLSSTPRLSGVRTHNVSSDRY